MGFEWFVNKLGSIVADLSIALGELKRCAHLVVASLVVVDSLRVSGGSVAKCQGTCY